MPYIKQEQRAEIFPICPQAETVGELNYQITELCRKYMVKHGISYQIINDIVGALEGAKLEFYRRVAVPYENAKIAENGDVYGG